jgi:hypothetical protein
MSGKHTAPMLVAERTPAPRRGSPIPQTIFDSDVEQRDETIALLSQRRSQ